MFFKSASPAAEHGGTKKAFATLVTSGIAHRPEDDKCSGCHGPLGYGPDEQDPAKQELRNKPTCISTGKKSVLNNVLLSLGARVCFYAV